MKPNRQPTLGRTPLVVSLLAMATMIQTGCGGSAGAWIWWLTDPEEKVKAEYRLAEGPLAILIDDEKGWLADPAIRPLLAEGLTQQFAENKVNRHVVPNDRIDRLRQKDPKFDRRGAREIGERLNSDQVLLVTVRNFTLHDDRTVDPAYKGKFVVAVKVLDVHATKPEDVRLWPRSTQGRIVEVTTDLHTGKGSSYDEKLTRRLCGEMAEKIAKLFYDHTAPKRL